MNLMINNSGNPIIAVIGNWTREYPAVPPNNIYTGDLQMDHQSVYQKLINKAQSRQKPDCYTERHHILPKSLGGSNNTENLVDLTAREHFIAHLLLAKIYGGPMICALWFMSQNPNGKRYTNRIYEWIRIIFVESRSGKNHHNFGVPQSQESNIKRSNALKGVKKSPETIERMRKAQQNRSVEWKEKNAGANKGKKRTEEYCRKMSDTKKKEMTAEMKCRISNKLKGRKLSEETLLKRSLTTKGRLQQKTVTRIFDKREMTIQLFTKWLLTQTQNFITGSFTIKEISTFNDIRHQKTPLDIW